MKMVGGLPRRLRGNDRMEWVDVPVSSHMHWLRYACLNYSVGGLGKTDFLKGEGC